MKKVILLMFFLSFCYLAIAQNKFTISGHIKNEKNGEALIFSNVYVDELKIGTVSNEYGFYSVTIPQGKYNLRFSFLGFQDKNFNVDLQSNKTLDVELPEGDEMVDEVIVTGEGRDRNVESIEMSVEKIQMKAIKVMPAFMGEVDILRTIKLLPGIQGGGEGSSGLYVRGGGPDENLLLLDEAPVYNASHLLGFFSVFNSDAIKDLKIYKGGIPAQYGGKASSVIDIKMKDGNSKRFSGSGGISNISSRLTLEGPIIKDKWSFIVAGRRTYADILGKAIGIEQLQDNKLYFYDLNAKTNIVLGKKDKLFVSAYTGDDYFGLGDMMYMRWGNLTTTVRWNHLINSKIFLNTTALFSRYDYNLGTPGNSASSFDWKSRIQDESLKFDLTYFFNPNNTIKFGLSSIYHHFEPGKIKADDESFFNDIELANYNALEHAAYLSNEHKIGSRFILLYGLRLSIFQQIGSGTVIMYKDDNPKNVVIDKIEYKSGEVIKNYIHLEPRLSAKIKLNTSSSVKLSYNRMVQNLHLISNTNSPSPFDIWLPSNKYIKPLIVDQVAMGYFKNFANNTYETSVEVYYKNLQNVIDYIDGAELFLNKYIETELLNGEAYSYGAEFLIKKQEGKLTGWLSYTLSKTQRKIPGILNGREYAATYDRTHDFSIVSTYKLSKRWTISANWVYTSGNRTSYPETKYSLQGNSIMHYSDRNSYKIPDYHRLDLSATFQLKTRGKKQNWKHDLNLSVYNVYGRRNAYSIAFSENEDNPEIMEAVRTSIIGAPIPAITYNFKF